MTTAFRLALTPPRCNVLGLDLQPLTLGHLFLLDEHDSAYFHERKPEFSDLLLSVFICSLPPERAARALRAWWTPLFMRLWSWTVRRLNLAHEFGKWSRYWSEGNRVPDTATPLGTSPGRELRSPLHWRLFTMLTVDFQMTEAEAMQTTVVRAHCLWATQGDRNGTVELASPRLHDLAAYARAQDAAGATDFPNLN